ncbi:unnamed protein product [Amoebophrya sp. A120]|nr:unnamed protein product [Amoebophrya sp. A120]|eukprot:GSA120T00015275001.1
MGQSCVRDTCERGSRENTEFTVSSLEQGKNYDPAPVAAPDGSIDVTVKRDAQGRRQGFGRIKEQGYEFEGNFVDDVKEGHGTLWWADGRTYQGQFENGKFHGRAIMVWADGRQYEGEYNLGRKHGQGVFLWPDGRRYDGAWFDGRRHGKGTYTNAKKETRTGIWENDRPVQWDPATPGDASQMPTVRSIHQQK